MATEKSREDRLRRTAARRGLLLEKCRRRDPLAIGYGTYQLIKAENDSGHWRSRTIVAGDRDGNYGLSLDEVESYLNQKQG